MSSSFFQFDPHASPPAHGQEAHGQPAYGQEEHEKQSAPINKARRGALPSAADAAARNVPDARQSSASSCDSYAPALTALFDGEATAAEAWAARAHLGQCVQCARMWFLWTRTRSVLQSAPPSRVPAGLLARILLACRLSLLHRALSSRPAPRRAVSDFALRDTPAIESTLEPSFLTGYTLNATLNEPDVTPNSWPTLIDAPVLMDAPATPTHLREAILRRTVGISVQPTPAVSVRSALAPSALTQFERTPSHFAARSAHASHRIMRWAMPVAAPAMLVWMAMSTPHAPRFTQPSESLATASSPTSAVQREDRAEQGKDAGARDRDTTRTSAQRKSEARGKPHNKLPFRDSSVTGGIVAGGVADGAVDAGDSAASLRQMSGATASTILSKTVAPGRTNRDGRSREAERAVIFASGPDARLGAMRAQSARPANPEALSKLETVVRVRVAVVQRGASSGLSRAAAVRVSAPRTSAPRMTPAFSALPAARAAGAMTRDLARHTGLLRTSNRDTGQRVRLADDPQNGWQFAARPAPGLAHKSGTDRAGDGEDAADENDDDLSPSSRDIMDEYRAALLDDGADNDAPEKLS